MPTGVPNKIKQCKLCGKEFMPSTISQKFCKEAHYNKCPICGKKIVWNSLREPEPCSKECRKEATRRRNIEKYGCEHPMQNKEVQEHHKQSMIEKYGVESPLQSEEIKNRAIQTNQRKFGSDWALSSPLIKHKSQKTMMNRYGGNTTLQSEALKSKVQTTMMKRYGVDNPQKNSDIHAKTKETLVEKYGVDNPMKYADIAKKSADSRKEMMPEIVAKIKETWMKKYGYDNVSKSPEIQAKIRQTFLEKYGCEYLGQVNKEDQKKIMIERYGVPYYVMSQGCRETSGCTISSINRRFSSQLADAGIANTLEYTIENKSYDIYIPSKTMLIEIDPTYTHNLIGNHWGDGIPISYHIEKTLLSNQHNMQCMHIFDWDNATLCIEHMNHGQNIDASQLEIRILPKEISDHFLNIYSFKRTYQGNMMRIGLYGGGILYLVMAFGKPRYSSNHDAEIIRYAHNPKFNIIGGYEKIFEFITDPFGYNLQSMIAYQDIAKPCTNIFDKLPMTKISRVSPRIIWSKGKQFLYQSSAMKIGKSEKILVDEGYLPVPDCGYDIYEWRR